MPERELLLKIYRTMILIRRFEEKVEELFKAGDVPGFVHVYKGEEAVAAGVCAALRSDDYVVSTHRGHGHAIAKGVEPRRVMAEILGRATGTNKGIGGSMHIIDVGKGFLGANGIAGGGIPHAVGAAFACKYKGVDRVSVTFFGDGAASQGVFHESMNIASLWKLPVIFVCENNLYAVTTHLSKQSALHDIYLRAASYEIPGLAVDGMDAIAVYRAAAEAVERARRGEGPTLIECKTYRFSGHYVGDPEKYREREEVRRWTERDPIKVMRDKLIELHLMGDEEDSEIWEWASEVVEDAAEFAKESPYITYEEARGCCFG